MAEQSIATVMGEPAPADPLKGAAPPDAALAALTEEIAATFEATMSGARRLRKALSPLIAAAGAEGLPAEASERATVLKQARQRISTAAQTSDAAAQRLEHIAAAVALAAEHDAPERGLAAVIIAAQAAALAETLMDETFVIEAAARVIVEEAPALARLVAAVQDPSTSLDDAIAALDADGVTPLRRAAGALADLAPALGAAVAPTADEAEPTGDAALAWMAELYTMEAERQVHAEALQRRAMAPLEAAATCEAAPPASRLSVSQRWRAFRDRVLSASRVLPRSDSALGFRCLLAASLTVLAAGGMAIAGAAGGSVFVAQGLLAALACGAAVVASLLFDHAQGRTEERIAAFERMALRDPLTDLLNRRGLMDRLAEALMPDAKGAYPDAAVLHVDLDHFKAVNDTLGHEAGDHVLVVAVERMRAALAAHTPAGEVCRIGGDEFCVILTGEGAAEAERVAGAIVASLREPIDWQGKTCRIGASIGIAHGGEGTAVTDPQRLLTDADLAAYTAKAEGRGRYALFDAALREEMEREARLVAALGEGLAARRLEIWLQPVVTIDGAGVFAAEALLRWRDPALGDVPPETLMTVAERHSLLDHVHAEIVRLFADTVGRWQAAGMALPLVTLNLSPLELRFPDVAERIVAALREAGVDPGAVGIEVTEAALGGRGGELAQRALSEAAEQGLSVIVDRFGRDDCALSTVRAMGARLAKIDRGLVAQLGRDADGATLLHGLVSLARSLSLGVVATGVETREQLDLLREVGCDGLQGFAVARPMPAESFAHWLAFAERAPVPQPAVLTARVARAG